MHDFDLFKLVLEEMNRRQERFYHMIDQVGPEGTPAQKAIHKYLMEKNYGS